MNADSLTRQEPDHLPANAEKFRTLKTDSGDVEISRIDGYRVLYLNDKNAPFVNMKVELSANGSYESDQRKLIANLSYLSSHSIQMGPVLTMNVNGYDITGISRTSIEKGSTLGTFVCFPGSGVTVYFYFNNMKPEYRNFRNLEEYQTQRDIFLKKYTAFLKSCIGR